MSFFEQQFSRFLKPKSTLQYKRIRVLSIILVYLAVFGMLFFSIRFLIPEIVGNFIILRNNLPLYLEMSADLIKDMEILIAQNIAMPELASVLAEIFDPSALTNFFSVNTLTTIIQNLLASTMNLTGFLLDLLMGFVIAVYALLQKETFVNGSKRLIYAILNKETSNKILSFCSDTHFAITKFFVGKTIDSLIIGCLCFLGLSLINNPYALLLSVIVGICNMIPYFGPFIGAIPAVILTLFEGIPAAIMVALFILILQQFDGLYLGPKILGESIGITPFWIITAILIGGALWGPLGMFFASPVLAVILTTLNRWLDLRLSKKDIDLPKLAYEDVIPAYPTEMPSVNLFKKNHSNNKQ